MTQTRADDAGITLVEVLVVLAIMGVMAGVVGLSIGTADRGAGPAREAQLLSARLNRAVDEVVLTSAPTALFWDDAGYRMQAWDGTAWQPHPVALLGTPHALPRGVRMTGADSPLVLSADLVPQGGDAVVLTLSVGGGAVSTVRFDGTLATIGDTP